MYSCLLAVLSYLFLISVNYWFQHYWT